MNMTNMTGPPPGPGGPGGPGPNPLFPTDTREPVLLGVASMFIVITVLFVGVRVYIRGLLMKRWGHDDSMFVLAAYLVATVTMYQFSFTAAKAAVLLQYRRAFAIRSVRIFCDIFLGVIFVFMVIMIVGGAVVTRPLLNPDYRPGSDQRWFLAFGYANAATNLLTDVVIFILPLPLVGRLQLATMQKIGLIVSFGVGIFTGAISVLRISSLPMGIDSTDTFYEAVPLVLLTVAEPTTALVCACVPILRPLMTCSGGSRFSSRIAGSSQRPLPIESTNNGTAATPSTPRSPTSPTRPEMTRVRTIGGGIRGESPLSDGRSSMKRGLDGKGARRPSSSELSSTLART
ncbi:hypothetical protein CSOJ01_08713 [Colletotrichum sojae]|uniref:Rhodopsin domain-containing protein n=1 Tax=Colletotrichum sojae TaxID=2175907 RepID=A0A8H6J5A1_9PEZI|nr:hypothetical protein CSOJ01_08713 [Colletotrichum sojae]